MCVLDAQYVKWANKTDLDDFWTDPKVKRLYKNHIYAMTSRTNVYNGEGRCLCHAPLGAYIKALALKFNLVASSCGVSTLGFPACSA